jgi:hypothetical protein
MTPILIDLEGPCICGSRELQPIRDIDIIYTELGEKQFHVCEGCRRIYELNIPDYPFATDTWDPVEHGFPPFEDRKEYHYYKLKGRAPLTISQWSKFKRRIAEIIATVLFVRK